MSSFLKRTVTCGELRRSHAGSTVTLNGWVDVVRDHGGLLFLDLRDRYGLTQVVVDPAEAGDELLERARSVRPEFVVAVVGLVRARPGASANAERATGEVEVVVKDLQVLNASKTPPFTLDDSAPVSDEIRLKYRYLDIRRASVRTGLEMRHKFFLAIRRVLDRLSFIEIETPMLTRMTPEGSREYLVPSRVHHGKFYALPQSPQVFKQLLMIGGMDKYFQIARCLRDEDLRADRQPEFTQLDLELSFGAEEDVFTAIETVLKESIAEAFGRAVEVPFRRMPYREAIEKYGVDKPDLRFGLEIADVAPLYRGAGFRVIDGVLDAGGAARGIVVPGGAARISRKEIDELTAHLAGFGAKGLAFLKTDEKGELAGPLARFTDRARLERELKFASGDLLLVVADKPNVVNKSLGELRNELARRLDLIPKDGRLAFAWIVDFPMFEWSEEEQRFAAAHHPFTTPLEQFEGQLEKEPGKVTARAYDLVLNGWELGSGSVRIHQRALQQRVFECLGIAPDEARARFGFFLEAFEYGAPPHAGLGLGLDRTLALLLGRPNIRDLVAFPKTASASCLMTDAPAEVPEKNLRELGLRIDDPPKKGG